MRTCVHHGEESLVDEGYYRCQRPGQRPLMCRQDPGAEHLDCFVPLPAAAPEPAPAKDATPVTFAAILRYHRRRAQARDGDPAWHAEAVECLRELALDATRACHYESCLAGPYDSQRCHKAACPVWQARKAVEVEP